MITIARRYEVLNQPRETFVSVLCMSNPLLHCLHRRVKQIFYAPVGNNCQCLTENTHCSSEIQNARERQSFYKSPCGERRHLSHNPQMYHSFAISPAPPECTSQDTCLETMHWSFFTILITLFIFQSYPSLGRFQMKIT